jgi:hypothetical protein
MSQNIKVGIVTAAGYTEAERYYGRLHGLLEAIKASELLTEYQKKNLIVMGTFSSCSQHGFPTNHNRWRIELPLHLRSDF